MNFENVTLEKNGKVATIVLNRPEKLNAINNAMMADLASAIKEIRGDADIHVLILRGAGRSFSVGQDLSGIGTSGVMPPDPHTKPYISELLEAASKRYVWWRAIFDFPRFTIAQVHGYCLGMGCELAMACKTIIAAEGSIFGDPSIRMGLAPGNPLWTWKIGLRKTKEMLFTGKYIDAAEAEKIGLVMKTVPASELDRTVQLEAEAQVRFGGIGGFDGELIMREAQETDVMDMAGLAGAWRYASLLHTVSSVQRPGRSMIGRGGFDFHSLKDEKGLRQAILERDAPFEKYFPSPAPQK